MREKWREREREIESLDFSPCTVCMYLYPIYNFILACKWERWDYYPRLFKKFGCNFNLLEDILVDFYILGFISYFLNLISLIYIIINRFKTHHCVPWKVINSQNFKIKMNIYFVFSYTIFWRFFQRCIFDYVLFYFSFELDIPCVNAFTDLWYTLFSFNG